jgi:hypothetical protein
MPVPVDIPPAVQVQQCAPATATVTQEQAQAALAALRASLKSTRFVAAWPAALPGMVAVKLESGEVGYTDKTGRYFVFGLVLDTATGNALDKQLEGHP